MFFSSVSVCGTAISIPLLVCIIVLAIHLKRKHYGKKRTIRELTNRMTENKDLIMQLQSNLQQDATSDAPVPPHQDNKASHVAKQASDSESSERGSISKVFDHASNSDHLNNRATIYGLSDQDFGSLNETDSYWMSASKTSSMPAAIE